jgi:hypothetical protein
VSRTQRFVFLGIAVAIAVVAALLFAGREREEPAEPAGTVEPPAEITPTPQAGGAEAEPRATPEPTATPRPRPPLLQAGREQRLRVTEGELVRFRVRHDTAEHVHVHGYDIFEDVPAGETVTVSFEANITGVFEIELEDSHQLLATLRVDPR